MDLFGQVCLDFFGFVRSDLFDISGRKDPNFAIGLPEPPAVLLLVVDVDHLPVGDAQLVVPGQDADVSFDIEEEIVIRHGLDCKR